MAQANTDAQNAEFCNTLCGTGLAQMRGIEDASPASLKKFDDWYLDDYPYLLTHVPVHTMRDLDVPEIGLGYGILSQQIAVAGARYEGLEIAPGPVNMVRARLAQNGLSGGARQGNMLRCPLPDASFDCAVSIGCFDHTGDTQRCLNETWRVLRPGAILIVPVPYMDDLDAYLDESLRCDLIHIRSFDLASLRLLCGKVHGLTYVEHTFVEPCMKDALLRIRPLPESSLLKRVALNAADPDHPLWTLRKSTRVSQEALRAWLFELCEKEPAVYREVLPELVDSLEVNIVFRRPA
jgi:SAM-dependent methyltransferase